MNKEKSVKGMLVMVPPSLLERFKAMCDRRYATVSGTVKKLMVEWIEREEKHD